MSQLVVHSSVTYLLAERVPARQLLDSHCISNLNPLQALNFEHRLRTVFSTFMVDRQLLGYCKSLYCKVASAYILRLPAQSELGPK